MILGIITDGEYEDGGVYEVPCKFCDEDLAGDAAWTCPSALDLA